MQYIVLSYIWIQILLNCTLKYFYHGFFLLLLWGPFFCCSLRKIILYLICLSSIATIFIPILFFPYFHFIFFPFYILCGFPLFFIVHFCFSLYFCDGLFSSIFLNSASFCFTVQCILTSLLSHQRVDCCIKVLLNLQWDIW